MYGADARVLVERVEELATCGVLRIRLEALRLLLSYTVGPPPQHFSVSGQFEQAKVVPVMEEALARLSPQELEFLRAITRKLEGHEGRLLRPAGREPEVTLDEVG
jgi:hypothetical protein